MEQHNGNEKSLGMERSFLTHLSEVSSADKIWIDLAFLPKRGLTNPILIALLNRSPLQDYGINHLNVGNYTITCFLSLSQSDNKFWFKCKLIKTNCLLSIFRILSNFLSDRILHVRISEQRSADYPVRAWLPQGSILRPILFNIHTCTGCI